MSKILSTTNAQLWGGTFGLERETLRVTTDGYMAQSPHPFPNDSPKAKGSQPPE